MQVEHLAIDGSVVSIEADADLSTQHSTAGWAIVPSLGRAHPFAIYPAGHSDSVEEMVRSNFPEITVQSVEDYSLKKGRLRVAEVTLPTATKSRRTLMVGAWEGRRGCLTTSLVGAHRHRLVEVFDTLQFRERGKGLVIDSPITPRPREPQVFKEIPGLGVLDIKPALPSTLERVPRASGFATDSGELFRFRETSNTLLFVGNSAVVRIDQLPDGRARAGGAQPAAKAEAARATGETDAGEEDDGTQEMLAIAQSLRVEWMPRGGRR
ncbi:MAG TPA: hypothetical protein VF546_15350 [Pyrinomonadaceae bacterium]|jgi:hypothetical protein